MIEEDFKEEHNIQCAFIAFAEATLHFANRISDIPQLFRQKMKTHINGVNYLLTPVIASGMDKDEELMNHILTLGDNIVNAVNKCGIVRTSLALKKVSEEGVLSDEESKQLYNTGIKIGDAFFEDCPESLQLDYMKNMDKRQLKELVILCCNRLKTD